MTTQHYLFMNGGINQHFTGIENSVFKRYKLFTQHLNIRPIYLCMYYELDLHKHIKSLKASGHIPEDFRYVNLYEFFLRDCDFKRSVPLEPERTHNTHYINHNNKKRIARVYEMDENKRLAFVNYYDEDGIRYRLDKYDTDACLSCSILFSPDGKQRVSAHYFRQDGSLALAWYYAEKEGKHKVRHIVRFDKHGLPCESFLNEDQLYTYLLRYYLNSFSHRDQINLFIDRHLRFAQHLTDGSIIAKIKVLHTMHSTHLEDPSQKESKLHSVYNYLLDLKNFDGTIALTPEQSEDIKQRFGDYGNVHCIPHPLDYLPKKSPFSQRIKHRVIAVGRFSEEKQHNKMIRIFAKVVATIPDAQLDLFGKGELQETLKQQVEELGLQNNIHFKGFTHNIGAEFETAQCSLLTSRYEGQPLVVLESLSFGCPVISSDICYGPASMIQNGQNGFLLPKDDETQFAERIIQLLTNSELAERLSENAYKSVERFAPENIAPLWRELLDKLSEASAQ